MKTQSIARKRLLDERVSVTKTIVVGKFSVHVVVGRYPDGRVGELFCKVDRQGEAIGGMMDAWATTMSLALQYGVPLGVLCEKLVGRQFEPSGWTGTSELGFGRSVIDVVARWLMLRFGNVDVAEIVADNEDADEVGVEDP